MIGIKKINKHYIKSDDKSVLDKHFAAIAIQVNETGTAKHAGLIINCPEGYFLCHFDSSDIEIVDVENDTWYFHKTISFILPEYCGHFLGHCKQIVNNNAPDFAPFYQGSYYINGEYYTEQNLPEYMTCVGFCINLIKGWLHGKEYFQYTDWTSDSVKNKDYIAEFIRRIKITRPHIDESLLADNIRRIFPSELLASAYLTEIPIRKAAIDEIHSRVEKVILERRLS